MAPFLIIWALVWVILSFPGLPNRQPMDFMGFLKFIAALLFLIYCLVVLLVDTGNLHLGR